MASLDGITSWEIRSLTHVVNHELQGFLGSREPVLAASSFHVQTSNIDGG